MELAITFIAGALVGWLLGRFVGAERKGEKRTFRPNKRQREILATLPPDPERPTIEELVREEAHELGVDRIPGAEAVPLGIRLKVWKRDHESAGPCEAGRWRFVVQSMPPGMAPTAEDVRLECRSSDRVPDTSGDG